MAETLKKKQPAQLIHASTRVTMSAKWGLSYIGYLAKKHLDVFDRRVAYKLALLTAIIVVVVVVLALIF